MAMLINPRVDPEATFCGWARHNANLIAVVTVWATALLCIAVLGRGLALEQDQWYSVGYVDGIAVYIDYLNKEDCLAAISNDALLACLPGADATR